MTTRSLSPDEHVREHQAFEQLGVGQQLQALLAKLLGDEAPGR